MEIPAALVNPDLFFEEKEYMDLDVFDFPNTNDVHYK